MSSFTFIVLGFSIVCVLGVLALGIFSMARGGAFNKKYGNKLMQARVYLQGLALALLALAYFMS